MSIHLVDRERMKVVLSAAGAVGELVQYPVNRQSLAVGRGNG